MAYNPNKRKNIYDPGTPTGRQINRQSEAIGRTVQPIADAADKYAGGRGARQLLSGAGKAVSAVADDARRTRRYANIVAGRIGNDQDEAVGRGFKPAATMPQRRPATFPKQGMAMAAEPTARPALSTSTNTSSFTPPTVRKPTDRILLTNTMGNSNGEVIGDAKRLREALRSGNQIGSGQAGRGPGPIQVGNMDVTFSPNVPQDARARFLQDPVSPAAQGPRSVGYQGNLADREYSSITGSRGRGVNDLTSRLLTKENSQGMGWKARNAINQAIVAGEYGLGSDTLRAGIDMARINAAANDSLAARGLDRERLGIDRQRANSETTMNAAKTAESQQSSRAIQALLDAKPGTKEYNDAAQNLLAITGRAQQKDTPKRNIQKMKEPVPGGNGLEEREYLVEVMEDGTMRRLEERNAKRPSLPRNAADREVGQEYDAPDGTVVVWDGKGLKRINA